MSRGGPKITRSDYYEISPSTSVNWLDRFAQGLQNQEAKTAVEVARQQSMFDQINSIVGNKPAHATVESKVQDLQERTGLKAFLQRSSIASGNPKLAQAALFPSVSDELRNKIFSFIRNLVETHRGLVPVPAVQEEILNTFRLQGLQASDVNSPEVAKFVSDTILEVRQKNPSTESNVSELGRGVGVIMNDEDGSNSDFFKGLLPANQG